MIMIWFILFMYQIKKFEKCMDLLLITDENKSYYVFIKNFNRFMCNQTKSENRKQFCRYCLQRFSSDEILQEHGKESEKLKRSLIKFLQSHPLVF